MPSLIHALCCCNCNYNGWCVWCCVIILIIIMCALAKTRTTVSAQLLTQSLYCYYFLFYLFHDHKKRCTVSSHWIFNENVFINANTLRALRRQLTLLYIYVQSNLRWTNRWLLFLLTGHHDYHFIFFIIVSDWIPLINRCFLVVALRIRWFIIVSVKYYSFHLYSWLLERVGIVRCPSCMYKYIVHKFLR